jgi:hypothetical protein
MSIYILSLWTALCFANALGNECIQNMQCDFGCYIIVYEFRFIMLLEFEFRLTMGSLRKEFDYEVP